MNTSSIRAGLLASLAVCGAAQGMPIQYTANGTITSITGAPPYGMTATVGQGVSSVFVYDPLAPDLSPSPAFGHYNFAATPNCSYTDVFGSGDVSFTSFFDVFVTLDPTFDELEVHSSLNIFVNGTMQPSAEMYLHFRNGPGTVFQSDALPPETLTMANWQFGNGYLRDVATGQRVDFTVTALTGVPTPPGVALLALAAVPLRRRR